MMNRGLDVHPEAVAISTSPSDKGEADEFRVATRNRTGL